MDKFEYLKTFLEDRHVGAFAPTSASCVRKMMSRLSFHEEMVMVEYGPGDGVTTQALLENLPPDSRLILVETNEEFCRELAKIDDDRISLYHDDARNIKNILAELGIEKVDQVISGIPFTYLTKPERRAVLQESHDILKEEGTLVLYQLSTMMKSYLKPHFHQIKVDVCRSGIFPMFIMSGRK